VVGERHLISQIPWLRPQWTWARDSASAESSTVLMGTTTFLGIQQTFDSPHKWSIFLLLLTGQRLSHRPSPFQQDCKPDLTRPGLSVEFEFEAFVTESIDFGRTEFCAVYEMFQISVKLT